MADTKISKRTAYLAILTLGLVSMLGDIVYESGRGIAPDYLMFLGASAVMVGIVSGAGEFLGYGARLISGTLADKSKAYWVFIFAGYGLILAIPLIGLTYSLELVIVLILLERLGKALRSPPRDTVVSVIGKNVGSGKAFGIHEAIDQIGGILGPLLFAAVLFFTANNYQVAFGLLIIPYVLMMIVIAYTYRKVGKNVEAEAKNAKQERAPLTRSFWLYCLAVFLNTLGLIPVALILFSGSLILQPLGQAWIVPLLYVIVQGVDAPMALVSGHLFDKLGIKLLALPFTLSVFPILFVSLGGLAGIVAACVMFGLVLGMQESIYRAAVCAFVPLGRRGTAYGVFNTILGIGTLASGVIFGFFIESGYSATVMVVFALVLQAIAIVTLWQSNKQYFKKLPIVEI
ncbi:MAG: MFS transporter [Candidatus Bathyarchaeota archaeon]|nr:MFS transporter [Candidatus Bathyarchaeota archaeon]